MPTIPRRQMAVKRNISMYQEQWQVVAQVAIDHDLINANGPNLSAALRIIVKAYQIAGEQKGGDTA